MIAGAAAVFPGLVPAPAYCRRGPLRIGLTAVILDQKLKQLQLWQDWLERKTGLQVSFVQRRRYREITDLLLARELDAAWICGYPYVRNQSSFRLLAIPSYAGGGWYHSLIVVHAEDESIRSFDDLAGKRFVFSDPDSNSGYLYPQYRLRQLNRTADAYFARSFFSWGHPNTVEAIAVRLGDAGAVDSYVWDMLNRYEPGMTANTRVIEKSPRFGFPPLVTMHDIDGALYSLLSAVLLGMHADDDGRMVLASMGLDGFLPARETYYDGIRLMADDLG